MKEFWDNRYSDKAYAYGIAPNRFFEEQLLIFIPVTILMPGMVKGAGVLAARSGWL